MTSMLDQDLSLYREWPRTHVYADNPAVLELKSAPPDSASDELWRLLNEMTAEMREQFQFFRSLREGSGAALDEAADDAVGKGTWAVVKAATDAISLIVRTLEKIDTLQRQLARDREAAAEDAAGAQDYEDAVAFFQRRIDDLVRQKVRARLVSAGVSPDEDPAEAGK